MIQATDHYRIASHLVLLRVTYANGLYLVNVALTPTDEFVSELWVVVCEAVESHTLTVVAAE